MSLRVNVNPEAKPPLGSSKSLGELALAALAEHRRIISSGSGSILKNAPESAVTLVELPGYSPLCVKEFRWRGWAHASKGFFRSTQGLRAFRNGGILINSGFGAAFPLALIRERRMGLVRAEWIIMEYLPRARELDRYILTRISEKWTLEEQRGLVRIFGRFMARLHYSGVFHSDLKTCNIMVADSAASQDISAESLSNGNEATATGRHGIRFFLLDYDDVRFCRGISWKQRTKNLTQIFLSTPLAIGAAQRLRFLSEYSFHSGISLKGRRNLAERVMETAGDRDILYVGFNGDIRENWRRKK
ncbi:MAG: hypothetical protein HY912_10295 [Desulfomonile tiedjei]|uniref:Uncharacterized protein n=1 Tax=Desulfomonile tiedjei TaxID=2358 RepID=A0A9D6V1T1_9BACT|nr:hypothetical protein [Desulfomonile tiedjei]